MLQERSNARRFLDAFNGIEQTLRSRKRAADGIAFWSLVNDSPELSPIQRKELQRYAKLRNVIVHNVYDQHERPIADPRLEAVEFLERQLEIIENPPLVLVALGLTKPVLLEPADDVSTFLALVQPPDDFSQAPVRTAEGLALITTNAVARWVSTHYEQTDGGGLVPQADLEEVLRFAEAGDRLEVRPRGLKVVEALRIFGGELGEPPAAIALTHSGRSTETPIGICVRADVPRMFRALGF